MNFKEVKTWLFSRCSQGAPLKDRGTKYEWNCLQMKKNKGYGTIRTLYLPSKHVWCCLCAGMGFS